MDIVEATTNTCPRCSFTVAASAPDCPRCGVVFAKIEEDAARVRPSTHQEMEDGPQPLGAEGRKALAVGTVLAVAALAFGFPRFVFSYLSILVHELGHAATGWAFGYPSIPSFDFMYGGGITPMVERQAGVLVLVYAGWALLLYLCRHHVPALAALAAACALYTLAAFTGLHRHMITFMGHGAELVFAGVFLYRGLNGSGLKTPLERPLYAFAGLFVLLHTAHFALRLATSPLARDVYVELKGGMEMDFAILAAAFGTGIGTISSWYLGACALTVLVTWWAFRYRDRWQGFATRVFLAPLARP